MAQRLVLTLVFITLLLILTTSLVEAQVLSVTATVPVSDVWAEAIVKNSKVLSVWDGQELSYFVRVIGLDYEILDNHKVQLQVFLDDQLVTALTQESKDFTKFSFIPKEEGRYHLIFTDITWDRHIELKELEFDQPRIKIFNALDTFFLLSSMYIDESVPNIIRTAFVTGKPTK